MFTWSGVPETGAILPYLLGAAGLVTVHERLRASFEPEVALLTTVLLFAGTSLFWSMTRTGGLADALGFAVAAIAALVLTRTIPHGPFRVFAWAAIAALVLGLRIALQTSAGSAPLSWTATLFSSTAGLLALTPLAYVAVIGLIAGGRRDPDAVCALGLVAVLIAFAVWLPPAGTDGRFAHGLTPALAVLAPGLAMAVDRMRRRPWAAVASIAAAVIAWNYWLMVQYTIGTVPKDGPVSFAALVRQQADVHTRPPYVYPFAFPANAWFAWREGLPVDRYETLAFEPRRTALDLPLDRSASRFLLDGWEATAADAIDAQVWIRERRATLAVPLSLPRAAIDVTVTARARLEEPAVVATLGVEVNGYEIGRFDAPPGEPVDVSLRTPADIGSIWRAGYNRVTFVSYGVARVDPADRRPPGPLARRTGDRAWPVAIYRLRIAAASAP